MITRRTPTSLEPSCRYTNRAGTAYGVIKHSQDNFNDRFYTLSEGTTINASWQTTSQIEDACQSKAALTQLTIVSQRTCRTFKKACFWQPRTNETCACNYNWSQRSPECIMMMPEARFQGKEWGKKRPERSSLFSNSRFHTFALIIYSHLFLSIKKGN